MPIFEYICKECDHQFEALVYGKDKASCPKCQSKKLAPQLSVFAVSAKGTSSLAQRAFHRPVRILRRPARSGRLLARRHELAHCAFGSLSDLGWHSALGWRSASALR